MPFMLRFALALSVLCAAPLTAQGRQTAAAPVTEPAMLNCPSIVGDGVLGTRTYCDVQIGHDPADGILVNLPPHRGPVTLMFDLHNRHTYSEDLVRVRRAYSRYTATIGVLTMNNHLISRAVAIGEVRTGDDLFDRITGGSGPEGLKAVAPVGIETITLTIPDEGHEMVSILGEKMQVARVEAQDHFTASGLPIALISNVQIRYTPAPPTPARR